MQRPHSRAVEGDPEQLPSHGSSARWIFNAFGLAVLADLPVVGAIRAIDDLSGCTPKHRPSTVISQLRRDAMPRLEHRNARTIVERLADGGGVIMRITHHPDGRYRVEAPDYGTFTIEADGSAIHHERLGAPEWRWHRALCSQVLPIAATLQGFEAFHASAVELRGRAVGFIGNSGAGKSSLAFQLIARGAPLLTDDVLSLELREEGIIGHPGVHMASIAPEQLALIPPAKCAKLGTPIGTSDKVHLAVANMASGSVPLGALCFLERSSRIARVTFDRVNQPVPTDLLGATFTPHIVNRVRLQRQLNVCAEIAATVPIFHLRAPSSVPAARLALAVEQHIDDLLS